ncbi:MAG: helix-turn-helix domain-containing protein [Bacteroidota bacterium]
MNKIAVVKEENIRLIFGLKLKLLRQDKNFSLSQLSQKTDISISYLNEIEKGKKYPKADKIFALAEALDVSYDWLVSLKLNKKLGPLSEILKSNILSELPLDVFGIQPGNLLELISAAPAKLNAFISTLIEISRNYNLTVENFYFSVLRTYQEMYENYFPEIEKAAETFREKHLNSQKDVLAQLIGYLTKKCNYEIDETTLPSYPELTNFRSVLRKNKSKKSCLMIDGRLTAQQKIFVLSREVAYHFLKLEERSLTYTWQSVNSFDEILNNFKATYFAGALLLPEKKLANDIKSFFSRNVWDAKGFLDIMYKHNSSPETFLHRLTSIIPRHFELNKLFFVKIRHIPNKNYFQLTKELHLSGLHTPHATASDEHYCRRWLSVNINEALARQLENNTFKAPICNAQISSYAGTPNKYFCISIARPQYPNPEFNCSLTIGFPIDRTFKERVTFWKDSNVPDVEVGQTCERCSVKNCKERSSEATVLQKKEKELIIKKRLKELLSSN